MFDQSSQIIITGGQFNQNTPSTPRAQHETDRLLQHCALAALLDSSERIDPARCHPNTRDGVIEEIMAWIEDSNPDASMMVMHGPAGSGKSALAQSIAERCKLRQWLAAAFFFSRTAPGRNNGQSLIPTIAYQLISSYPEMRLAIHLQLWRKPTLLQKSIPILMEYLLIAPFFSWITIVLCWITGSLLFSSVFGWVHPRLIVIDGLDECADNEIQCHILRAAATARSRLRRPFRILIICRPEIHIMRTLKEPTVDFVPLDLGKHNANHDIQLFLSDKFEELKQTHPLAEHDSFPPSWPGSDIIAKIAENASGQFIYASVIMVYIGCSKHSPVDRLNFILRSSPKPDRDTPFETLDALYTHILTSIEDGLLMQQILSFMAIPRTEHDGLGDYTTPAMIAMILSPTKISSVFLILEQLRSVVNSAGPDEPIKFWHASISDFLLDKERSTEFFVDIRMAHEALARGYLRFFQAQPPWRFVMSPLFSLFLEHYKRALLSEQLQQDLVAYNFFSAYKAAVGEPITLQKLRLAWESGRVQTLFHTLVLHSEGQRILDDHLQGLHRNYPLDPCTEESLNSFLGSRQSQKIESAIHQALCVTVLHFMLNCGDTATVTSIAEKSAIGILTILPPRRLKRIKTVLSKLRSPSEFTLACDDCISILLPHASHYSTELVNLLLEQQRKPPPPSEISVEAAVVGPYLEQFEHHVDATLELKVFLEKYRASKRASDKTSGGPGTISRFSDDIGIKFSL